MIRSYKGKHVESIAAGRAPKGFPADLVNAARRKLYMLEHAEALSDLLSPPANRLEALRADRVGQHSIRINDKWRLCFVWSNGGADQVEIVDYH